MPIAGTPEQALVFLNTHWGHRYSFALPEKPSANWTATAKFGGHDFLQAPTPAALLETVRAHYRSDPAPPTIPNPRPAPPPAPEPPPE
jgi:hypothetical protein